MFLRFETKNSACVFQKDLEFYFHGFSQFYFGALQAMVCLIVEHIFIFLCAFVILAG